MNLQVSPILLESKSCLIAAAILSWRPKLVGFLPPFLQLHITCLLLLNLLATARTLIHTLLPLEAFKAASFLVSVMSHEETVLTLL